MGAIAHVSEVRSRRLLRQLEEQARHRALPGERASRDAHAPAGRELEVVLRRQGVRRMITREWPLLPVYATVIAFFAFDDLLLGRLESMAWAVLVLAWLFAIMLWAAFRGGAPC